MDVGLLATIVGTTAAVASVPFAAWQVWMQRADRRARVTAASIPSGGAVGASVAVPLPAVELRGRRALLDVLRRRYRRGGVVVLAGLGGVGKSSLAAEVARSARQRLGRRPVVWWVAGTDVTSLTAGMVTVARQLGADACDVEAIGGRAPDGPDRLWALLERSRRRWLLVVDNADAPPLLLGPQLAGAEGPAPARAPARTVGEGTGWVRASRRGLVLVTSRHATRETWGRLAEVVRVGALPDEAAAAVLHDLAPGAGGQAEAEALARRLGGLPLALHLAGRHLGSPVSRWSSFAAYREALDAVPATPDVLVRDPCDDLADDDRATILRTWELSLDDLAARGAPEARPVLRLLSCFASSAPIPLDLVRSPRVVPVLALAPASAGTLEVRLERALRGLESLGLLDAGGQDGGRAVAVHPVVADTNRAYLGSADPGRAVMGRAAAAMLAGAVDGRDPDQPATWAFVRTIAPHLQAVLRATHLQLRDDDRVKLAGAAVTVAKALDSGGAILIAHELLGDARASAASLGASHPAMLEIRYALAYEVGRQGRWHEAEGALRTVLQSWLAARAGDHPSALATRSRLAWAVANQGRWREAEAIWRNLLADQRRLLGEEHPLTLSTRHALARTVQDQGRWHEAEAAIRDVVDARRRVLGEDHPGTLTSRHQLAETIADLGRSPAAEAALRDVLDARRRVLGDEHISTLATAHELARTLADQGRWREAESLWRRVAEARRRALGEDHPYTLMTLARLAQAAGERGRWREAERTGRRVVDARRRVLGDDHPYTLTTRHDVARAIARQDRWAEADTAFREVLEARRRVLGDDHPNTLKTWHELGRVMAGLGRLAEAESIARAVLEARLRVLGDAHPATASTRRWLVELQRAARPVPGET